MATSILTALTIEEAIARSHDVFTVLLEDWGTASTDRYPLAVAANGVTVINQAAFPQTPAGIAIGPNSTVDRAWLSWNTQKGLQPSLQIQEPESMAHIITHERPLMFAQPAGVGRSTSVLTPPSGGFMRELMQLGLLYVLPSYGYSTGPEDAAGTVSRMASTILPPQYYTFDGQLEDFPTNEGNNVFFIDMPTLELQFILKPGILPPAGKRLPYQFRWYSAPANGGGVGVPGIPEIPSGDETLVGAFPTFGRKTIVIGASATIGETVFRVAALRGLTDIQNAPGEVNNRFVPQETTEGQKTTPAADVMVRFQLCDPCADYILLYATSPGPGDDCYVRYTVTAYD